MIKTVKIKNVQSHKDSEFNFVPGVNIISGSSNNGKTVVLRALNWIVNNRPGSVSTLASNSITDDKGTLKGEMSVEVETDKGIVKKVRSKSENKYILNGDEFGAVGKEVPQDVTEFFGLEEVNLQSQMDSPFLLSLSGPEATRFINKVVKLDCIDSILSNAESDRRFANSQIKCLKIEFEEAQKEIDKYDWLPKAEDYVEKIKTFEQSLKELNEDYNSLDEEIEYYNEKQNKLFNSSEIDDCVKEIEQVYNELDAIQNEIQLLNKNIFDLKKYEESKYDFTQIDNLIEKIINYDLSIVDEWAKLNNSVLLYKSTQQELAIANEKIFELNSQLPETCPYCGSPIHKENCNEL